MTTRLILSLTLLATSLTLSATSTKELTTNVKQQSNSISNAVANILYEKGIEKKSALKIASKIIGNEEELFSIMLHTYTTTVSANHNNALNALAKLALNYEKADLSSYAFLIKLTYRINKTMPNKAILNKLDRISTNNSLLKSIFA